MYNRIDPEQGPMPISAEEIIITKDVCRVWGKMLKLFIAQNPHITISKGGEEYTPMPNGDIIMSIKGTKLSMVIKGEEWSWAE
jgi:hypothetical protein